MNTQGINHKHLPDNILDILRDDCLDIVFRTGIRYTPVIAENIIDRNNIVFTIVKALNSIGFTVCPYYYQPKYENKMERAGFVYKKTPYTLYINIGLASYGSSSLHEFIHSIKIINQEVYDKLYEDILKTQEFTDYCLISQNIDDIRDSFHDKDELRDELLARFYSHNDKLDDVAESFYNAINFPNDEIDIDPAQRPFLDILLDVVEKVKRELI